jgi:putative MATE family efflux protein
MDSERGRALLDSTSTHSLVDRLEASGGRARSGLIWALAMPVLAQNVLGMFVGWSDMILAGQILKREEYIAAGAVASYLLWFIESLGSLIHSGSYAIVARRLGAREIAQANYFVQQSLILAAVLGVVVSVVVPIVADTSARLIHLDGPSRDAVGEYLRIVATSGVPMMILVVGSTALRAAGHNWAALGIFLVVNLVNIVFSWCLAVGGGPFPAMGWAGIAWGTSASFWAGGLLTLALLIRGYDNLRLDRRSWMPSLDAARRILAIGVPGAASSLVIVVCQLWFLSIIGHLGDTATAAHGVAIRCESLSYLWAESFSIAAATLVGQSLGAGRPDLARRYGWKSFVISTAALCVMGVIFWLAADNLVRIFTSADAPSVREQGAAVLRIIALGMPALSASIVLTGALRGAGDTRYPFLYNAVGMLLFRIPLAYALTDGVVAWGLWGAWIAMVVDLYVRGLFSIARYVAGSWTRQIV